MALKSEQAADLDAEPQKVLQTGVLGGRERTASFVLNTAGEGDESVFDLIDLPVKAVVKDIKLKFADWGTGRTLDIGATIDADRIVDGLDVASAGTTKVSLADENGGTNGLSGEDYLTQLWDVLGYASRVAAGRAIRVRATLGGGAAPNTDGALIGQITYVVD